MGMDVYGKHPRNDTGSYFRNNVWWWHPLATYCQEVAPNITVNYDLWHSNDGAGLGDLDAQRLATLLQKEVDEGRTLLYEKRYTSKQEKAPNEPCWLCEGTGTRLPPPHRGKGNPNTTGIKCNSCDGTGFVRPAATNYSFSEENVKEFITFLRNCGGFEIC